MPSLGEIGFRASIARPRPHGRSERETKREEIGSAKGNKKEEGRTAADREGAEGHCMQQAASSTAHISTFSKTMSPLSRKHRLPDNIA